MRPITSSRATTGTILETRVIPTLDNRGSICVTVDDSGGGQVVIDHEDCLGKVSIPASRSGRWTADELIAVSADVFQVLSVRGTGERDGWGRGVHHRRGRIFGRRVYVEKSARNPVRQPPRFDIDHRPGGLMLTFNSLRTARFVIFHRETPVA